MFLALKEAIEIEAISMERRAEMVKQDGFYGFPDFRKPLCNIKSIQSSILEIMTKFLISARNYLEDMYTLFLCQATLL